MRPDEDVKRDVLSELRWEPRVNEARIGVTVRDGAVALSGAVHSFHDMDVIKDAAWHTRGGVNVRNHLRFA